MATMTALTSSNIVVTPGSDGDTGTIDLGDDAGSGVTFDINSGIGLDTVTFTFADEEIDDVNFSSMNFENETYA